MRGSVLDGLHSEVLLHNAAWLADDSLAQHLTLLLDGWSNARMESIYSFNIVFPDRRMILLKSEDLSTTTHSGENIAGVVWDLHCTSGVYIVMMHWSTTCVDANNAMQILQSLSVKS